MTAYLASKMAGLLQTNLLWLGAYPALLLFRAFLFQRLYIIGHYTFS